MKFFQCDVCGRFVAKNEVANNQCPRCGTFIIFSDGGYMLEIEPEEAEEK